MIIVTGKVQSTPERRQALIELAQIMCRASREEEGCIDYRFYEDSERPDRYVFLEEWQSQEALDRHFATAHTATFMSMIGTLVDGPPEANFHAVAHTQRLGRGNRLEDAP